MCKKVYNFPTLLPVLQKTFQYCVEGENITPSSDSDYATLPSD